MGIRLFSILLAMLIVVAPFVQVVRCQVDAADDIAEVDGGELGIVGDEAQDYTEGILSSAPGVETIYLFPKNAARSITAGQETYLLVGLHNEGGSALNVIAIKASLHVPYDHRMLVQNLTVQEFYNASVPLSTQATFPYTFAVSKYLQPGSLDLVGTVVYEIDQQLYQNVFYNGTVEIIEASGFLTIESVFLVTLGVALIALLFLWAYGRIQQLSKKTKRAPKVEVGTATVKEDLNEWLQGTAYTQSLLKKSKKKK
ncbi:hypothetical protein HPP92_022647 [Vanilla planifolia]|uniref:Translocon-associated protein subunit alpha n=1 Tax=Vanilla planifolia TaxID=51239 RepID=A0A835PNX9_VANPL|nr:hypothetical protein HPP92_022647 [Vanilla planifolia]